MLDDVVAELREIDRRTGVDRVLAMGELILNRFFGGNPLAWRDRRKNKNNSIRRLANRDDCPFCRSALNEAVGVYVAVLEIPSVRTFGHIYASHVACVLALPPAQREEVLKHAEDQGWSVRELREEVVRIRRERGERRGRPTAGADRHALSALHGAIRQLRNAIVALQGAGGIPSDVTPGARELGQEVSQLGWQIGRLGSQVDPEPCQGAAGAADSARVTHRTDTSRRAAPALSQCRSAWVATASSPKVP